MEYFHKFFLLILNEMRKLERSQEAVLDDFFISISESLNPFWYYTKHTPNWITLYGLITAIIALWYLSKEKLIWFSIFGLITIYLDNQDGSFARQYDQCTVFGDRFDHIRDIFFTTGILLISFSKWKPTLIEILPIALVGIIGLSFTGCHQKHFQDRKHLQHPSCQCEESLDWLTPLCYDPFEMVGVSTSFIFLLSWIFYLKFRSISLR